MLRRSLVGWIALAALFSGAVHAQVTMEGGRGLLRVQSANVVGVGDIYVSGVFSNYFEKIAKEKLSKYYYLALNGTIGLPYNMEVNLNMIPYQDNQTKLLGRFGDLQLGLKYRLPLSGSFFQWGWQSVIKFPTAFQANVPYESFSTEHYAWCNRLLFTLDFSRYFVSVPFKFYQNVGYYDHNVKDIYFQSPIDQLLIGTGLKFSIRSTQYYVEYTGELFINNTDTIAFRDNATRITFGSKFIGPAGLTMDVAMDYSFATRRKFDGRWDFNTLKKDYADWRLWIGVTHRFSVYKYFDSSAKIAQHKREQELRKLEQIKRKRIRANRDIERMRELLEKKKPKDKN